NKNRLEFPLDDSIYIMQDEGKKDFTCIVSNSDKVGADIFAPEIDFYINSSQDDINSKISAVKTLYDARMISYDMARYFDYEQEIGNLLLVISSGNPPIVSKLKEANFKTILLKPEQISYIEGHLGELKVGVSINEDEINEVKTDQIVWFNAPKHAILQSGIYDFSGLDEEEIVDRLKSKLGLYKYKNLISYNVDICQYHQRREEICAQCAKVCPTVAITKNDENRELIFSHIDCEGCGECVSVCPSGALDYTQMTHFAFSEVAKLYRDKVALIIPRKMTKVLNSLNIKLPKGVLPFAIEGEKYLDETHFLTLLQESKSKIVFFTDLISPASSDAISILNQIYRVKYKREAITVATNEEELKTALKEICFFENSHYGIDEDGLKKREIFSARLSHLVGKDDLGVAKTGQNVHYGVVNIDKDRCTLCLSCVGACNVGALSACEEDFSLRVNSSVCTTCKYCEFACPEKCIEVIRGEIPLNSLWFSASIAAKDEMFECVVCGVPFATKRSVEKIANMIKPFFVNDEVKTKTLYCCAQCKPKLMFQEHIFNEQREIENGKK
ncbi:MAG: 4Fe-4S binding protein, partial [Campylobacteraceae bacterium]|nr:4Fe-4S binding protein [Campylobacteraceae bacterium]